MLIPGNDVQADKGLWQYLDRREVYHRCYGARSARTMGERNNGENKVFPIQVSRQELLLFLCVVIVIVLTRTSGTFPYPVALCDQYSQSGAIALAEVASG